MNTAAYNWLATHGHLDMVVVLHGRIQRRGNSFFLLWAGGSR